MWDECLAVWKICLPLHPQSREKARIKEWCGSSAWLEYMPVTHGVAGSSPVRTAKPAKMILQALFFYHQWGERPAGHIMEMFHALVGAIFRMGAPDGWWNESPATNKLEVEDGMFAHCFETMIKIGNRAALSCRCDANVKNVFKSAGMPAFFSYFLSPCGILSIYLRHDFSYYSLNY